MNVMLEYEQLSKQNIDDSNINAWYELFLYDSLNEGVLSNEFYKPFFFNVYSQFGVTKEIHNICFNYLENNNENILYFKMNFILLYEAFDLRLYTQALNYITLIKQDKLTTIDFYIETCNTEINIYISVNEFNHAIEVANECLKDGKFTSNNTISKFTYYYNISILYALVNNRIDSFKMLDIVKNYTNEHYIEVNYFKNLCELLCNIFLNIDTKNSALNLFNLQLKSPKSNIIVEDYAFQILVLSKINTLLSSLDYYNLIMNYIFKCNDSYYKAKFYNILISLDNEYITNIDRNNYFKALEEFFNDYTNCYLIECSEMKNYMELTKKYNIISKKYMYDRLTGIYTRNELIDKENNILDKNVEVIFFDIDNLKKINDSYGHITGDNYIKVFANILLKFLKNDFDIYRYGGDEFVAIAKNSKDYLSLINEIIMEAKNKISFEMFESEIEFSYGVYISDKPIALKYAIYEADRAMYQRKIEKK